MKKSLIICLVLLFCASAFGIPRSSVRNNLGNYTGPITGAAQDDNVKSAMDLVHNLVANASGRRVYVDSTVSGTAGDSWSTAVGTINEAIDLVTANSGDIILIAEGFNVNLTGADAVDLDKAGVKIVGYGVGSNKPRFDFDDVDAEIVFGAANVQLINVDLRPGVALCLKAIDIENAGDNAVIRFVNILEGESAGTDEFVSSVIVGTTAVNPTIENCTYFGTGTGADNFVNLDAATIANPTITGCTVFGQFLEAPIWGAAAVPTNISIKGNTITNNTSGQLSIEFQGAATGIIAGNILVGDTRGSVLDPGSARCSGNTQSLETDTGAIDVPLVIGKTYVVTKAALNTATTDDLFLVTGYIQITNFFGEVTTVFAGSPGNMTIELDSADDDYDSDFSTTVTVDTAGEGDWIKFTNVIDESVLSFTVNTSSMPAINWLCSPGMIEQTLTSTGTGATTWYMTFIPLTSGVTVVPQ